MNEDLPAVLVVTTGGTFDKIYFDAKSSYEVGTSMVGGLLSQANVRLSYEVVELMRKDSLDLTDDDRRQIHDTIAQAACSRVVITHGTDTMTETAAALSDIGDKTIVLTGALAPARFADSDAMFNLGMAFAAVQVLGHGIFIAMNGRIFDAARVKKDRQLNAFVDI